MAQSTFSSATNRSENLHYFKTELGLDDTYARLLMRAERLQEKGEIAQALTYFQKVLDAYPECNEAKINIEMIQRMHATSGEAAVQIPADAKLHTYFEGLGGMDICGGSDLTRKPDGRSEYTTSCDEIGGEFKLGFPKEQSDRLWTGIISAVDDGSGLSTHDPTNWHEDTWQVGVQLSITLAGSEHVFYTNGSSPVEKLLKRFVDERRRQVGM